jgi:hypothetical protein
MKYARGISLRHLDFETGVSALYTLKCRARPRRDNVDTLDWSTAGGVYDNVRTSTRERSTCQHRDNEPNPQLSNSASFPVRPR